MTTAPTLALERKALAGETVTAILGSIRVSAWRREYATGWASVALDTETHKAVGDGTGNDEYMAIASALLDAKRRAERTIRSLRDERAVRLMAEERE